jgi:hypothetical protein
MRQQKINKQGTHIYTSSNFENIRADYYKAQERLHNNQREQMKRIHDIIGDYLGENNHGYTNYQVMQELKFHYEQLSRCEMLKENNRLKYNALEYFVGQDESNELIPYGMIFA